MIMNKIRLMATTLLAALALGACTSGEQNSEEAQMPQRWSKEQVAKVVTANAELATTRVEIQKIVIWDSKSQQYSWRDFDKIAKNWFGSQKFAFPIHVTLTYGYDLAMMDDDDLKFTSDSTLTIRLPKPKLVASDIKPIKPEEIMDLSTGLRDKAGTMKIQEAKNLQYKMVTEKADSIMGTVRYEVRHNARTAITNLLRPSGYQIDIKE